MHFAIQGLKIAKTKELARDMQDRIIESHKGGQGYRKNQQRNESRTKYSMKYHQKV